MRSFNTLMFLGTLLTVSAAKADPAKDLCQAISDANPAGVRAALGAGASPNTFCITENFDHDFSSLLIQVPALAYTVEARGEMPEEIGTALVLAGADPELRGTQEYCRPNGDNTKKCETTTLDYTAGDSLKRALRVPLLRLLVSRGYQLEKLPVWEALVNSSGAEDKKLALINLYLETGADVNAGKPAGANNSFGLLSNALRSLYLSDTAKERFVLGYHFTNVGRDTPAAFAKMLYDNYSLVTADPFSLGLMQAFLAQGLDVNAENGYLLDAMIYSLNEIQMGSEQPESERLAIVHLLINHGADISHAIHSAISVSWSRNKAESIEVLATLFAKGSDLEARNANGSTPLYSAMYGDFSNETEPFALEKVKFLVAKGANVNVVNSKGLTPLAFAQKRNFATVAAYLQSVGAH